jgi:hypothetical protein
MEIKKLHREIIDEIASRKAVSSRGLSRERAVKRKMKNWHIKKDFSPHQAPWKPLILLK